MNVTFTSEVEEYTVGLCEILRFFFNFISNISLQKLIYNQNQTDTANTSPFCKNLNLHLFRHYPRKMVFFIRVYCMYANCGLTLQYWPHNIDIDLLYFPFYKRTHTKPRIIQDNIVFGGGRVVVCDLTQERLLSNFCILLGYNPSSLVFSVKLRMRNILGTCETILSPSLEHLSGQVLI